MEVFKGRAHLPGAASESDLELEIDWNSKEVNLHIAQAPGGMADWPGLVVQTFGPTEEIVFRTKGIPPLFTHWWHFARSGSGDLWGIVLATPDVEGTWRTCPLTMVRVGQ